MLMLSTFSRVKTINISSLTDFKCCNNLNAYNAAKLVAVIVSFRKTLHMTFAANYYYPNIFDRLYGSLLCIRVCVCVACCYNGPFSKCLTALLSILMNQLTCQ